MLPNTLRKPIGLSFQLLLRIKHPTLDPSSITQALDLQPEHATSAGQTVSEAGRPSVHSECYWLASLPTSHETQSLWLSNQSTSEKLPPLSPEMRRGLTRAFGIHDAHILFWLRKLESHASFLKRITHEQGSVTLILQRLNRDAPMTITPFLAHYLAELNIALEVD